MPVNRRCYSDKDLSWIEFIKRLKDTGMPIKEIQHYAELRVILQMVQNKQTYTVITGASSGIGYETAKATDFLQILIPNAAIISKSRIVNPCP